MNLEIFAKNIFIHESLHLLAALVISFIIYRKYRSLKYILAVIVVSFLVDIDHLTEGFILYGFDLPRMLIPFRGGFFREAGKMTIFFHSWEILPMVWFLGKYLKKQALAKTIILSFIGHLLVDQIVYTGLYGMSFLQYSLTYRALNHFDFLKLCGGCK